MVGDSDVVMVEMRAWRRVETKVAEMAESLDLSWAVSWEMHPAVAKEA